LTALQPLVDARQMEMVVALSQDFWIVCTAMDVSEQSCLCLEKFNAHIKPEFR